MTQNAALIFDLDGTLVDTAPDLLAALNAILAQEGRAGVVPADLRHLVGHGARAMIDEAFRRTGGPIDAAQLDRLVQDYIVQYRAHIAVESQPFPGVVSTLKALKAEGWRLGVLTNKGQELTDLLLPQLDLDGYFGAIHGAGRLPVHKPNPKVFEAVVAELGGMDGGAVMIGDSATDVATARAAGVPVIVVDYGYTPEPPHLLGGDVVTGDFTRIPELARQLLKI